MFMAYDVANALGYAEPKQAVQTHCKSGRLLYCSHANSPGGMQATFITEGDVYKLIMRSQLKEAEMFQDWVTDEVLPSIRKHGMYAVNSISRKELAKMLLESEEEKERLELQNQQQQKQIEKQRPKVELVDRILETEELVDIGQVAKLLGLGFGRNTLFKKLREKGIFFSNRNEPKQEYINRGYFELKEKFIPRKNHAGFMVLTPFASQRGLGFISTLFEAKPKNKQVVKLV